MKTKNFFFILFSICSGTKIFPTLAQGGYLRAFWHLVLLVFMCAIVFSFGNMPGLESSIKKACSILNQEFGGIIRERDKVYPQKQRDKEHHVEYESFKIDYFPHSTDMNNFKPDTKLYNSGIVWTPISATGWVKINSDQVVLYPALASLSDTTFFSIAYTSYAAEYIKKSQILPSELPLILRVCVQSNPPIVGAFILKSIDNFEIFLPSLVRWSMLIVMLKFFVTAILDVIFYGLIFAMIYRFTSRKDGVNYTFKNFILIAIYASFPPIIIGTVLSLAQTHWLDYSTIFIVTLITYLFFILNPGLKNNKTNM